MEFVASLHLRNSLRLLLKRTHSNLVTSSQRVLSSTQLVDQEVTYDLFAAYEIRPQCMHFVVFSFSGVCFYIKNEDIEICSGCRSGDCVKTSK